MKRFVVFVAALLFCAVLVMGATNNGSYIDPPFTADSLAVTGTVYTTLGSLTVNQDTTGSTLLMVTGTVELGNNAWMHLVICTDTSATGVPEIVVATQNDTTEYTTLGSLTVNQDTTGSTLLMVTGTVELGNNAWMHLVICTDVTTHEWWWRESSGDSKMRIPFFFNQNLDTDSVGGDIKVYMMGKVEQSYRPAYLHDVRIEGLSNLADE